MSGAMFVIGWLVGAAVAFWMFVSIHRSEFDVRRSDARLFAFLALVGGPIAIGSAAVVWWLERPAQGKDPVLLGRKPYEPKRGRK